MKYDLNELEIVELYKNNDITHSEIAIKYGCNHWNIRQITEKHGIFKDRKLSNKNKIVFSDKIKDDMITYYLNNPNSSQSSVAKHFNTKRWIVRRIFKERGISFKSAEQIARIYEYDKNFLNKIDSKEKAIFLGLFFADGCNSGKQIKIGLQEKDVKYLDFFNKLIFKDRDLFVNKWPEQNGNQKSYILQINDENMSAQMSRYGGVPRKSLILEWPKYLPDEYIGSFIQGYFEGDGCISKSARVYKKRIDNRIEIYHGTYYSIQIMGTFKFLSKMSKILYKLTIKSSIETSDNRIYCLRINKQKDIIKLYNFMYKDSPIVMYRKYKKFLELIDNFKNKSFVKKVDSITIEEKEK